MRNTVSWGTGSQNPSLISALKPAGMAAWLLSVTVTVTDRRPALRKLINKASTSTTSTSTAAQHRRSGTDTVGVGLVHTCVPVVQTFFFLCFVVQFKAKLLAAAAERLSLRSKASGKRRQREDERLPRVRVQVLTPQRGLRKET